MRDGTMRRRVSGGTLKAIEELMEALCPPIGGLAWADGEEFVRRANEAVEALGRPFRWAISNSGPCETAGDARRSIRVRNFRALTEPLADDNLEELLKDLDTIHPSPPFLVRARKAEGAERTG